MGLHADANKWRRARPEKGEKQAVREEARALVAEAATVKDIEAQTAEAGATIEVDQKVETVQGEMVGGEFLGDL